MNRLYLEMNSKRRRPELDQSVGAVIITRNE
jgi:hypothetical protein